MARDKILIPVDGSAASLKAAQFALDVARRTDSAHVFLINVQALPPAELMIEAAIPQAEWDESVREAGRVALEGARKLFDDAKIDCTATVAVGYPATQIAARTREIGCDRVIMGTRGLGTFGRLLLGSVAMRVVQEVDCPVTLVQ
jgi:nucleotide-binding universal stress UspA family protein